MVADPIWYECPVCKVRCSSQDWARRHGLRDRKRMARLSVKFAQKLIQSFSTEEMMAETLDKAREMVRQPTVSRGYNWQRPANPLREGTQRKGGVNDEPDGPRPEPPKGQVIKHEKEV